MDISLMPSNYKKREITLEYTRMTPEPSVLPHLLVYDSKCMQAQSFNEAELSLNVLHFHASNHCSNCWYDFVRL